MSTPADVLTRRSARLLGEILVRVALLGVAIYLLPRVFTGDTRHFFAQASHYSLIDPERMPYRYIPVGQHAYEFPPLTVPLLALGRISFESPTTFTWLVGTVMVGFELGSLVVLRRAWPEHRQAINRIWYASVVPLGLLGWFRYDFAAIFFATVGVVALERRARSVAAATVAGFGTKLWPAVLIPCLVVLRRWRDAALATGGCVALLVAWRQFSPTGFHQFLAYREGSGLEVESLPASIRLLGQHGPFRVRSGAWVIEAGQFGWVSPALTVGLVAFVAYAMLRAWRATDTDVVALAGALTVASFLFSRIISAQYVLWPAPFVAVLWIRGNRRIGWLSVAASMFTVGYLLAFDRYLVSGNRLVGSAVLIRNLLLVALLIELTRAIRPQGRALRSPRPEGLVAGQAPM